MSTRRNTTDAWLSILIILFAAVLIFFWIPADVETGLIEKVRSQKNIGDAMAPTVAGVAIGVGGLMLMMQTLLARSGSTSRISIVNLKFVAWILAITVVSFLIMRWAGPLLTPIILGSDDPGIYRNLRDTAPWKYIGYLSGGFILVFGLMTLVGRGFSWKKMIIAMLAVLALALIYDLPFDNLLLPPNGDV